MDTFGQRLRAARGALGYSQEQIGDAVGVTKATVSKWELDQAQPSLDGLRRLRELLRISLDSLICGESRERIAVRNIHTVMEGSAEPYINRDDVARAADSSELAILLRFRTMKPRTRAALLELLKPGD